MIAKNGWSYRMTMLVLLVVALPWPLSAQEQLNLPKFEVTGRVGLGTLKRFGDNYSDSGMTLGAGAVFGVYRRLGVGFDAERIRNLQPAAVRCGLLSCSGSAVEGVRSASLISFNALYYFPVSGRTVPFVLGSIGMLQSRSANAITFAGTTTGVIVQQADETDRGVAIGLGGGVRIPIGARFSVRPEIRLVDSTIRSRSNLSLIHTAIAVGYHW
jgi:outer membrane protein with beta-barrel domain